MHVVGLFFTKYSCHTLQIQTLDRYSPTACFHAVFFYFKIQTPVP
jgi:hypothetical protein